MITGISGMTSFSSGDVSSVGGSTPQAQAFAEKICTKLGACQQAGHDIEISSRPTGRGR